jgi:TPR repeat protein
MFDSGNGVAKDKSRALALTARGCELAEPVACYSLAIATERSDATRAAALFRRACDGGTPFACRDLAQRIRKGTIAPLDAAELGRLDLRAQELR